MSASIGLVMAPDEGDCYMELYQKADHALYQAEKAWEKSVCHIFQRDECEAGRRITRRSVVNRYEER